jgi:prephenate dehydratase
MTTRLAYFGPPGTNTEEAAIKYSGLQGGDYELIPFPTITSAALSIEGGAADQAILPVENSLDGAIGETLDFLIHTPQPHFIRDELVLLIEHYLLAGPGVEIGQVRVIKSIPTAVAQCRGYIDRQFPNATIEAALSTAAAVEEVMKRDDAAAIGNRRAAELYGAKALASSIQDRSPNHTRFVVVAREDHAATGDDKTSVAFAFATEDRPGQLVAALSEFGTRSINLSKIESRPSKERLGTYIFLVDLAGHRTDAPLAEALAVVEKGCSFFRVLGSYPRYRGE